MAKLVVLSWDNQHLRMVDARASKLSATPNGVACFSLNCTEGQSASVAARAILEKQGLARTDAIVVLDRAAVELRTLTVPNVPDAELADIVRFQAVRQFSNLTDDWAVDFVKLSQDQDHGVEVLAAAISPQALAQVKAALDGAKIKTLKIMLRPFATAALVAPMLGENEIVAVVEPVGEEVDITILQDRNLVATRSAKIRAGEEEVIGVVQELRRTIAVAGQQIGQRKVQRIIILSRHDRSKWGARIQSELGLTAQVIDPFEIGATNKQLKGAQGIEQDGFASLLGALVSLSSTHASQIDFINPRRRAENKGSKQRLYVYSALAAALAILVAVGAYLPLRNLDSKIAQLREQVTSEAPNSKKAQETINEIKEIDDWVAKNINWLDELHYLSNKLPPANEFIVDQKLQFNYVPADKQGYVSTHFRYGKEMETKDLIPKLREGGRIPNLTEFSSGGGNSSYSSGAKFAIKVPLNTAAQDRLIQSAAPTKSTETPAGDKDVPVKEAAPDAKESPSKTEVTATEKQSETHATDSTANKSDKGT
jgi:hypothetical protein